MQHVTIKFQSSDGKIIGIMFFDFTPVIELCNIGMLAIDLSALSIGTQLQILKLSGNFLVSVDLIPLSSCKDLQVLDLSMNQLKSIDLSALSECPYLQELYLHGNAIESLDLTPLFRCSDLRTISVDDFITLTADPSLKDAENIPPAIKSGLDRIVW